MKKHSHTFFLFISSPRLKLSYLVAKLCLTLCDLTDCNLPYYLVRGIFQASILEWVAISFSTGSSWPRNRTQVSRTADRSLPSEPLGKPREHSLTLPYFFLIKLLLSNSLNNYLLCCSFTKSCLTLFDPMDCSTPGFPALHYLSEFPQTYVHWVSDTIWPSCSLSSPSPAFSLSQRQGLFQ